jgi:hypothetical protein
MGKIIKKIIGDFDQDPTYKNLTIEDNDDGKVHIHLKNMRIDMHRDAYNILRAECLHARKKLKEDHGWK